MDHSSPGGRADNRQCIVTSEISGSRVRQNAGFSEIPALWRVRLHSCDGLAKSRIEETRTAGENASRIRPTTSGCERAQPTALRILVVGLPPPQALHRYRNTD